MPRPDITALKILSHTSRSFGENLKIIFFLNSHHLCCSFLSITFPFSPVLNISLSQRESVSQRISENSHTHTHTLLFPSACECLLCLEAVSNPRMCRCATTHPLQTALASVWVFVLFCVSACKCVFACVVSAEDVCVCVCASVSCFSCRYLHVFLGCYFTEASFTVFLYWILQECASAASALLLRSPFPNPNRDVPGSSASTDPTH